MELVLGLAINLAGGVGPSLLKVIRRCSMIAGEWARARACGSTGPTDGCNVRWGLGPAVGCGGAGV